MQPIVLAIDTSCDDTSAAVTCGLEVWSNVIASQAELHRPYGGVFPTVAKQAHRENIEPTVQLALKRAHVTIEDIQQIAVTIGPGLAPALEVGLAFAEQLARQQQLPLQVVNHIEGHMLSVHAVARSRRKWAGVERERAVASELTEKQWQSIRLPALAVVVSGKHTQFVLVEECHGDPSTVLRVTRHGEALEPYSSTLREPQGDTGHGDPSTELRVTRHSEALEPSSNTLSFESLRMTHDRQPRLTLAPNPADPTQPWLTSGRFSYTIIGQTLDDAAGEALDKIGRLINLGYPAGSVIEQLAKLGNPHAYPFPLPMTHTKDFNLSYSGLKTFARRFVDAHWSTQPPTKQELYDFCASAQYAIFHHLQHKLTKVLQNYPTIAEIWLGGGVAANTTLRQSLRSTIRSHAHHTNQPPLTLRTPYTHRLCQDNAAMIALTPVKSNISKPALGF